MGEAVPLLCQKLGGKLGYSEYLFRISYRDSENHIHNEYIEDLNRQFRQITKNKPSFTNDDSLRKMLCLASRKIVGHWTSRCRNWDMVLAQLQLMFQDRQTA